MRWTSIIGAAAVAAILPAGVVTATAFGSTCGESFGSDAAEQFSACMREQGLDNFPDAHLTEYGTVLLDGTWVDPFSPEYLAALEECKGLLPASITLPGTFELPAPELPSLSSFSPPEAPQAPVAPPALELAAP
ncbi:hypothetical protein [Jiangella alkaliphila]|uniref:Uncharacterized protein n=1 Tax=Jiangella alkaliphila TaxID=419479 RepID=A0A1H2LFV4_9ACTN|nr:hypothetical protein [Jiangella alkaliphila]SDU79615.1 hypothetical protein SAMN04488563_6034 [Jiangella alkaliphila]